MSGETGNSAASDKRYGLGLVAVAIGVIAILIAFAVALLKFKDAGDVSSVLGIVVSPIAAIVGAYFGVQVGSAGKDASDSNARANVAVGAGLAAARNSDEVQAAIAPFR